MTRTVPRGDARRGEIEILEERRVHESRWVEVFDDRVRHPDGSEGSHFRWHWKAPYGVVVLPVLDDGSVVLVEVYRHRDRCWRLEAPHGFGADGQSPEEAARTEALEETGIAPTRMKALNVLGGPPYPVHLFLGFGGALGGRAAPADEPLGAVHVVARGDLPGLLDDARIRDAETLVLIGRLLLAGA